MTDADTVEAIEEILEFVQEINFGAGVLSVQKDSISGADVYYVVCTVVDSRGTSHEQRVATVYLSSSVPPLYNAEFVAEMFAAMNDIIPELGEHILDSLDAEEQVSKKLSVAGFLADQIYSLTMQLTNNNEKIKQAWKPLLSILNIEPNVLEDILPVKMTQTVQAVSPEPNITVTPVTSSDSTEEDLPVNVESTKKERKPLKPVMEEAAEQHNAE